VRSSDWVSCQLRSLIDCTSCQSLPSVETAVTRLPARRPARSARLPAAGVDSSAFGSCTPIQCAAE